MASERVLVPENTTDTYKGIQSKIWGRFNFAEAYSHPRGAKLIYEDFQDFPSVPSATTQGFVKGWTVFTATGGTIVDAAIANSSGAVFASDGDNEGAAMVQTMGGCRITKNSGREVFFESMFRTSTIADTKHGFFVGLFDPVIPTATTHIGADGALVTATRNYIGFHRLEGDGDKLDIVYNADGQTQQNFTDAFTLVADTDVRVGFYFDGLESLTFFFNDTQYTTADLGATALDSANFPDDINLNAAFVLNNATGSTPGNTTLRRIMFGYSRLVTDDITFA
jgi:hypothetical protein